MFTHLHLHTEFSLLDGAIKIDDLVQKAKQFNMHSVAITDHGNMYGAINFYKAMKKEGLNPIIGSEVYISRDDHRLRNPEDKSGYHLVLLCKNQIGLKNLMKISSEGFINGFYYRPRVSHEFLEEHSEGLVALSACLGGEIQSHYLNGDNVSALNAFNWYKRVFKDDFYLEVQNHGIRKEDVIRNYFKTLRDNHGAKLVATNDCHYLEKDDAFIQEVLMAISTGKTVEDETRMRFETNEFYFKSQEEMADLFKDMPDAISNTEEIASKCNVEIEFGHYHLPNFETPNNIDHYEYLKQQTHDGIIKRYKKDGVVSDEVWDRVNSELKIIKDMGFVDYFLIVQDFILFAKSKDIPVGPGRGSSVGSIVCYALGIVDLDPLKYDLVFERFLNPDRVTMPDIDIDFCYERREEVIQYVKDKYGEDHVAQIITFGTMAAKAAIRDVGRVLNMSYNDVDRIAKMIPTELDITIDKALNENKELKSVYDNEIEVRKLIDISRRIEGHVRHASTHAAGVVIAKDSLAQYTPLATAQDQLVTQYTMTTLEELGLLKMDFLGLRTLTVIEDTLKLIEKNTGHRPSFDDMKLDDPETIKLFRDVKTIGIFQFESPGMRAFLKELKVSRFEHLIAANSLFRPGPMNSIPDYCKRKNSNEKINYKHPILEKILKDTYGIIVFQEQVIAIVQQLGGYTIGRADLIRRAMSKKKMDVMEEERPVFIKGAIERGASQQLAEEVFDDMIDFAKYAFNKSHSAAYSLDAWRTAWLKVHYPKEYMASLLTSVAGQQSKVALYIEEARDMGIKILPPDVNKSDWRFITEGDSIRMGYKAIKGLGHNTADAICDELKNHGEFKSLMDLLKRVSRADSAALNKRSIESLIYAGATDSLGINRRSAISQYSIMIDTINIEKRSNVRGQFNMFGAENKSIDLEYLDEYEQDELLEFEKDILGVYVSSHPLRGYEEIIKSLNNTSIQNLNDQYEEFLQSGIEFNRFDIKLGGMIVKTRHLMTKKNEHMMTFNFQDLTGTIGAVIFPNSYKKYSSRLKDGNRVLICGDISYSDVESPKMIVRDVFDLKSRDVLYIKADSEKNSEEIALARNFIKSNPGESEVVFYFEDKNKSGIFNDASSIYMSSKNLNFLEKVFGKENIKRNGE